MARYTIENSTRRIRRNAEMLDKNFLTVAEVMEGFLFDMVEFGPIVHAVDLLEELPTSVKAKLAEFFVQQRQRGYDWKPFFIGRDPDVPIPSYADKLRQLDELLSPHLEGFAPEPVTGATHSDSHA